MASRKGLAAILLALIIGISILPTQTFAASSVTNESHPSAVLNRTMNYSVYLPSSYSTNTTKRYPVLYLLHGMWGTYQDWPKNGMQSIVDNAGGKEMVIIMPDGLDAFYVDGYKDGMKYETYLETELIPYVESKYRIDTANGQNRAIAGLSMGGFGAAYHGFKYPDKFSAVYAMSGAFDVTGDIGSVVNKNKYPAFTMECGTEDTLVYQMNVNFHNKLQQLGVPHEYITRNGAHTWDFWKACLLKAIVFVSKYFVDGSARTPQPPTPTPPNPNQKLGDINNDGYVNSIDFAMFRQYLLGYGIIIEKAVGDLNGDGSVNSIDFGVFRQYLLGIISVFPASGTTNPVTPTPAIQPPSGTGALPAVTSVETDGPFSVAIDKNVGPTGKGWVVRPAVLGSQGVNKHPIFIWGPGGGETAAKYEDILRRIASHGFVIYSEASTNTGSEMKAGIDWLISQNNSPSSAYYNKLDTSKIGAGGHSLGSLASYGVADDSRITTTIHIDGGSLDGTGASKLRKPTALICGLDDTLALRNTQTDYKNATVPVWYAELVGVDHLGGPKEGLSAVIAWLRWHLAGETERKSMFIGEGGYFDTGIWQSQYKNW